MVVATGGSQLARRNVGTAVHDRRVHRRHLVNVVLRRLRLRALNRAPPLLKPERRHVHSAIQSAIDDFICHALGPEQDQTV